jgi:hypothetical protein
MVPHTKFSFSGLTGLVLLVPVLCMFYFKNTGTDTTLKAIPAAMPLREADITAEDTINPLLLPFCKPLPRNYKDLNITGDKTNDMQQLKWGRQLMRSLMASKDTINGIRFCFGKKSKYNELIKAITMCNEERVYQWMLKDNFVYVYNYIQTESSDLEITPLNM